MAITVACPSCEAKLKIGDQYGGRKIKCPKCETLIIVPLANGEKGPPTSKSQARSEEPKIPSRKKSRGPDEEEDSQEAESPPRDKPKKKKKKAKSGKGLWIGLGAAGGLVLVGAVVFVIVLMNNSGNTTNKPGGDSSGNNNNNPIQPLPSGNAALTSDNLKKIKTGMNKEDIIAIFGPARNQITGAEIAQKVLGNPTFGDAYQDEVNAYTNSGELLAYIQDGAVLLVGILNEKEPDPKLHGKIGRAWLYYRQGGNLVAEELELQNGQLNHSKKSSPFGG